MNILYYTNEITYYKYSLHERPFLKEVFRSEVRGQGSGQLTDNGGSMYFDGVASRFTCLTAELMNLFVKMFDNITTAMRYCFDFQCVFSSLYVAYHVCDLRQFAMCSY